MMESPLKSKIFPYLQLMRFANVFTAIADVLAGYLIVAGARISFSVLLALLLASSSLYAGGCVLNDLRDREEDARDRPFRPIPSGKVSSLEALSLCMVLFAIGLSASLFVGYPSGFIAFSLILLIFSYNLATKERDYLGPLNMGCCRTANLLLGMSPNLSFPAISALFPVISLLYVFSLTVLSRFEVHSGMGRKRWLVSGGWAAVVLAAAGLMAEKLLLWEAAIFLLLFIAWTGLPLLRGVSGLKPEAVGGAVKALILGLPLLDAVYVSGIHGFAFGIPVLLCTVPSVLISRRLYVT